MARYALANHVFVCLQDEHVVFLDVRQDRYFALEAAQVGGLATLVRGWPAAVATQPGRFAHSNEAQVAAVLARRGLLTDAICDGKDATPTRFNGPVDEIVAEDYTGTPRAHAGTIYRFVTACLAAQLTLRFASFERVVARARQHRAHASRKAANERTAFDPERTRELIATFASLRPYVFTSKDACLFEALALGQFLAGFSLHPHWVFGVQARPFAAHCWLQHEDIVLNDTVDHVSRYAPIMVV
jgi:hypothetical protein